MRITAYAFGRLEIDGTVFRRDLTIAAGRVACPWWRSAGSHLFAPEDLGEVIAAAPEVVVLGTGYFGRARVAEAALGALRAAGCEVIVERTGRAVKEFNRLLDERREVAAALHLTC